MGILKNNNNQSESNLRLPAIEVGQTYTKDVTEDGRPYPNSSLPLINQTANTSTSTHNLIGPGSNSVSRLGPS